MREGVRLRPARPEPLSQPKARVEHILDPAPCLLCLMTPPNEHTSEGGRDDREVPYHAESTLPSAQVLERENTSRSRRTQTRPSCHVSRDMALPSWCSVARSGEECNTLGCKKSERCERSSSSRDNGHRKKQGPPDRPSRFLVLSSQRSGTTVVVN